MDEKELIGYKEKTEHGDILMPIRHYHCVVPDSYRDLPLHWHEEAEIAQITGGGIRYRINFETYQVEKGDILLISPHTLHAAHEIAGQSMVSDSLVFHLDMMGCRTPDACTLRYLSPLQSGNSQFVPVIRPEQPGHGLIARCFQELLACFLDRAAGYEIFTKELLFHLFGLLYRYNYVASGAKTASKPELEEKLKGVLTYIQEHFREPVTISKLAEACHFSETYFMSFFKRFVGMTCVEYVNYYRLTRAAARLAGGKDPVMEVALDCGFRNISYFNRVFRARFGMTPVEYRKEKESRERQEHGAK